MCLLRLAVFSLVAISAASAQLQPYVRVNFWCEQGNQTISVLGYTSSPTTPVQASYPNSTVTVYLTGTGGTKAMIYSNTTGTALANPFTCGGSNGLGFFYAADGNYDINISGAGVPSQFTVGAEPAVNPFVTQPGGVDTPISQFFTDFPVSDQYATLSAALGNIQPGGSITIVGTYPLSAGITVATNNIRIQCQPGTLLEPMVPNLNGLLIFTGTNQQIDGCGFDSNGNTGTTFLSDPSATNFKVTNNAVTDSTKTGIGVLAGTPDLTYSTGTVSVSAGGTTVTGVGTNWTQAMVGGLLFPGNGFVGSCLISGVSPALLTCSPFTGPTVSGSAYSLVYPGGPAITGVTLDSNTFTGTLYNDKIWNATQVVSMHNTGNTPGFDCSFYNTLLGTFPNTGASVKYQNNACVNPGGVAMLEIAGNGIGTLDFEFNHMTSSTTPCGGLYSGGSDLFGGPFSQLIGGTIAHNYGLCSGNQVVFNGGNYCFESYGNHITYLDNHCAGAFVNDMLYDGAYNDFIANDFNGSGVISPMGNAVGFGFVPNLGGNQNPTHNNTWTSNKGTNLQQVFIQASAGGGDTISNNQDFRAFGAFPNTDLTQTYQSISAGGALPNTLEGNQSYLTAPLNGFSLSSPGSFLWSCLTNQNSAFATGPQIYHGGKCDNQNATQFGQLFFSSNASFFNSSVLGDYAWNNLQQAGASVSGLSNSTLTVYGNQSLGPAQTYSAGTVTLNNLNQLVTLAGGTWTPAMTGWMFTAQSQSSILNEVSSTSGTLQNGWLGAGGSGLSYTLVSPPQGVTDFLLGDTLLGGSRFILGNGSDCSTFYNFGPAGGATAGEYVKAAGGSCSARITMGGGKTAKNGWSCQANDITTPANVQTQTATTTTSATITGTAVSLDTVIFSCSPF